MIIVKGPIIALQDGRIVHIYNNATILLTKQINIAGIPFDTCNIFVFCKKKDSFVNSADDKDDVNNEVLTYNVIQNTKPL